MGTTLGRQNRNPIAGETLLTTSTGQEEKHDATNLIVDGSTLSDRSIERVAG